MLAGYLWVQLLIICMDGTQLVSSEGLAREAWLGFCKAPVAVFRECGSVLKS